VGTLSGIAAGAVALAGLDLLLGAGSTQVIGLASAPAGWLQKFVDPATPGVPWLSVPSGQVGKAGQLLQQIIPQALAGAPSTPGAASAIPAPSSVPPATPPAYLSV